MLLSSCGAASQLRYDSEFLAMGTLVQLAVLANDPIDAARLSAQIERTLQRQGVDWYLWTPDASGELKQLNAALAAGESRTVSPLLRQLLQRAMQLHQRSEGYFDPAVAPLIQAWGLADLNAPPAASSPQNQLGQWRDARPTLADLRINGTLVSSRRRDLQLDLGAIAKGYALQLALQQLERAGCDNAMLNMGGQVGVTGPAMAGQLSAVVIRDPRNVTPLAKLHLTAGESISTSGDYERFIERDGQRIHHLLDPHTGTPVTHTQAVTVISDDPTLADAASTALMAAGPNHWQRIARQLGIREILRVDATGVIEVTAALYARLQWNPIAARLHSINIVEL
jgi:FAD:protein FMN transferase